MGDDLFDVDNGYEDDDDHRGDVDVDGRSGDDDACKLPLLQNQRERATEQQSSLLEHSSW